MDSAEGKQQVGLVSIFDSLAVFPNPRDITLSLEELAAFDQLCEALGLSQLEQGEIRSFGDREIPLTRTGDWKGALFLENVEVDD
ncbi:MAG: hypothetical protein HY690_01930 [Chloroflexi bacterium]|nr:hypothetical protein [Chloroflexota bacterium]